MLRGTILLVGLGRNIDLLFSSCKDPKNRTLYHRTPRRLHRWSCLSQSLSLRSPCLLKFPLIHSLIPVEPPIGKTDIGRTLAFRAQGLEVWHVPILTVDRDAFTDASSRVTTASKDRLGMLQYCSILSRIHTSSGTSSVCPHPQNYSRHD